MLEIEHIDHVGIRIRDKKRSVAFYQVLGFVFEGDAGFERGHPIIMEHPSGVVLNLLGPATDDPGPNILMDVELKHTGITHVSLRVRSLQQAKELLAQHDISITGTLEFGSLHAIFIRDPDGTVIELDQRGDSPDLGDPNDPTGYEDHP